MQRINPYNFYIFGGAVHALDSLEDGAKLKDKLFVLVTAANWLVFYINQNLIPAAKLNPQPAQKLLSAIRQVAGPEFPHQAPNDVEVQIGWYEAYRIREAVKELEIVLSYDVPKIDTYCVSRKGIYQIADLVTNAENHFDEEERALLEAKAIEDIRQSGRCLAFECPTASGFHIARALETMLLAYLDILCPTEVASFSDGQRNLGFYIDTAKKNGGDAILCSALDQFRTLHRNPLMHPETVLTTSTALSLFGITSETLRTLLSEIRKLKNLLVKAVDASLAVPTS